MRFAIVAIVMLMLTLTSSLGRAQSAPALFVGDGAHSLARYHLVHKLHHVTGTSTALEAKARILPSGQVQVMVRVPSQSFDSGNVNRDEHMKETVEAARYPNIEIKGTADGVMLPATFPATFDKPFHVSFNFHGVEQQKDISVHLVFESPTRVRASCHFSISLDSFKIERPSLLFVKVNDELELETELAFTRI